jgi:hypothetical protein
MNGLQWTLTVLVAVLSLVVGKVTLDMANKEIQARLFDLPLAILRVARWRLPVEMRKELYDDELLEDELRTILYHTYDSKPITAIIKGLGFATGHIYGLRRSARISQSKRPNSRKLTNLPLDAELIMLAERGLTRLTVLTVIPLIAEFTGGGPMVP